MNNPAVTLSLLIDGRSYDVQDLTGSEGISELFVFDLEVSSHDLDLDYGSFLGAAAALTLRYGDHERTIHGIVSEASQARVLSDRAIYAVRLVPPAWLLTQSTNSRAFQGIAWLDDLLAAVIGTVPYRTALTKSYSVRDLYVQYQESDWDFLCRILEEHGIFYTFEHGDEGCTLVITDDNGVLVHSVAELPYHDQQGNLAAHTERVVAFRYAQRLGPDRMTVRKVSFDTPSVPVDGSAGDGLVAERYAYQGVQSPNNRLAAQKVLAAAGTGTAYCVRLASGTKFKLSHHPRSDFEIEYLVTHIDHAAASMSFGGGYKVAFTCIAASTPYVPALCTPRPTIVGPQAAQVVSDGSEIDVDAYGRVLVRMAWDRLGTSDASGDRGYNAVRVPVAQLSAGAGYGAAFVPRAGSYVLVEFLEGDPEKPVITGRAFNTLAPYPYALPANKTISTIRTRTTPYASDNHYHELTFQDAYGSEEVYLRAERQLRVEVKDSDAGADAQRSVTVYGDDTETVTGDQQKAVEGTRLTVVGFGLGAVSSSATNSLIVAGTDSLQVTGNRDVTVGTTSAVSGVVNTHQVTVYGDQTTTVNGDDDLRVTSARTVDVGSGASPTEDVSTATYAQTTTVRGSDKLSVSGDRSVTVNGNQTLQVDGSLTENIDGTVYQTYGSIETTILTGDMSISNSTGNLTIQAVEGSTRVGGNTVYVAAESNIEIRSATSISFVVGSLTDNGTWYRKITLDSDGIYISNGDVTEKLSGSHLKVNC